MARGCQVTIDVLSKALGPSHHSRFDLIEIILCNASDEMIETVKTVHPNILATNSRGDCPLANLIPILVNKFGIDVNHKEIMAVRAYESTLLHNLVKHSKRTGDPSPLKLQ